MKKNKKGFTLIELMIAISIIAIITIVGAPSISDLMLKNKIKTAANSMNSGIQLARSEAIKRNKSVIFTLNNEQWNVMADNELIALSQFEISETVNQDTTPSGATTLTFNNVGMLNNKSGNKNISKIILTSTQTDYSLWIIITNSGGSRVCNPDESSKNTSIIGCN